MLFRSGGRVGGLCADISRVFPVSGVFSERQRQIYQIVRECQKEIFSCLRPGLYLHDLNEKSNTVARRELDKLGLFDQENTDVTRYCWHNVSHHLGHDVHDVSMKNIPLSAGMTVTVEPGVYVPQWGFGIRLEDDVLITEDGCDILSHSFARDPDEISTWVKGG